MDTTEKPFQIIFSQVNELRMGSPFNACKIKIIGEREIKLPNANGKTNTPGRAIYQNWS